MKELRRLDHSRGVGGFQELLSEVFHRPAIFDFERTVREPGLDIAEIGDKVIVKAELPGMEEGDINVHLDGDMLTISGRTSAKREIKKKDYVYLETRSGEIQRSFRLPREVAKTSKKSSYKDGVLTIEFLKK